MSKKVNCSICNDTGKFMNPFDQEYNCTCMVESLSPDEEYIQWMAGENKKLKKEIKKLNFFKAGVVDFADGYRETLKYDLEDAIEHQEQQDNEDFNAGREAALKYAIEMIDRHLNSP